MVSNEFCVGLLENAKYTGDATRQARLEEIQSIITNRNANETQYDDSIVRQMIECIKVHGDGRLTIIFGGGYEVEETL